MVGLTLDEKIEMNISYFDSLGDKELLTEWQKIKNTWGENPQSSKPLMHAIFDYFLNHRLPYINRDIVNG